MKKVTLFLLIIIMGFTSYGPPYSKITIEYYCLLSPCYTVTVEKGYISLTDQYERKAVFQNKIDMAGFLNTVYKFRLDTLSDSYINNYADDGTELDITLEGKNQI